METALRAAAQISYWALTLYLWMILAAVLLSWVSPDPRNPLVAFLNRMTAPLWNGLARALPGRWRLFASYAALLLVMFGIEFVPGVLLTCSRLAGGQLAADGLLAPLSGFFLRGVGVVLYNLCYFLVMVLLIWFVLTLVSPSLNNPVVRIAFFLVDPILTPLQRVLPRMRVDLSPLLAAGVFLLINMYAVSALIAYAASLTSVGVVPDFPVQRL
jgi:YggT family protein